MKCPVCQAKLLPVDGELFCLQCGNVVKDEPGGQDDAPLLEETTDPILQRAIVDAVHHQVHFRLPIAAAPAPGPVASFASMRSVLAPPRAAMAGGVLAAAQPAVAGVAAGDAVTAVRPVVASAAAVVSAPAVKVASAHAPAVSVAPAVAATAAVAAAKPLVAAAAVAVPAEVEVAEPPKIGVSSLNLLPVGRKRRLWWQMGPSLVGPSLVGWVLGAAVFVLFVGVNIGLSVYYSSRVYPGVKVGSVVLGGEPLSSLGHRLSTISGNPELSAQIGGSRYVIDTRKLGAPDVSRMEREVQDIGRTTPLPLAGVIRAMLSKPVPIHYVVDEAGLDRAVVGLEQSVRQKPSDAVALIVAGQAFVIPDKHGSRLNHDKAVAAIRDAFGTKTTITLETARADSLVTAAAYKADVEDAQARMALSLQVKVKSAAYNLTPQQIGSWLVFGAPGKGTAVDGALVSDYVASLPGNFDRVAATNAVIGAIQSKQSLEYAAVTKKNVPAPHLARLGALPAHSYSYCTQAEAVADAEVLLARAGAVLGDPAGWAMGGALRFVQAKADCDLTIRLVTPSEMAKIDPQCGKQTTCQVGNVVAISSAAWAAAPSAWKGSLDGYRGELINHEVGHWLGFDHASCLSSSAAPILQQPTVQVAGCSPGWYALPAEVQGTKVLAGF